jgi:phosphoribosyl 1,2-cyclic phosphate phosphodiesterase
MGQFTLQFLGTGTSVGVPMVGCDCATCQSSDPRDQRSRCSIYCTTPEAHWVVDTGPDFRMQCLRAKVRRVDAVLYTHPHMDHLTGFDELRRFTIPEDTVMPIYARPSCLAVLERMFEYAFNGQNRYRGYLKPEPHEIHGCFDMGGLKVTPLPVLHGKVETLGFLFSHGDRKLCAYISDVKTLTPEAVAAMVGVDTLIIDGLRITSHPTHMNWEEACAVHDLLQPRQTWLTHVMCEIMHGRDEGILPAGVDLAYDGLELAWTL